MNSLFERVLARLKSHGCATIVRPWYGMPDSRMEIASDGGELSATVHEGKTKVLGDLTTRLDYMETMEPKAYVEVSI